MLLRSFSILMLLLSLGLYWCLLVVLVRYTTRMSFYLKSFYLLLSSQLYLDIVLLCVGCCIKEDLLHARFGDTTMLAVSAPRT